MMARQAAAVVRQARPGGGLISFPARQVNTFCNDGSRWPRATPARGRVRYSRLPADWRAMKVSKPFSATRNHSTSSARKAM